MSAVRSLLLGITWAAASLIRVGFLSVLLVGLVFAGFVIHEAAQPVGRVGADPAGQQADLGDLSYWEFMTSRLDASRETPVNCHRTRLIALALGLPLYPALYTYIGLYPESSLARHVQPSPLIPQQITWQEVPETWFRLVKEVSWLVFTQPLWDYTPAVGERARVDEGCQLH